ncbi:MAG: hypothetical protein HZB85_10930 [Deltaproteobacteria bacterium]|nr:hypothetical protein [Deltaproteobacteria bacterium]
MSDNEIDELAGKIAKALSEHASYAPKADGLCHLSEPEQQAVRDLIRTKRHAVKAALFVFAALVLWILKDAYMWIVGHLAFK